MDDEICLVLVCFRSNSPPLSSSYSQLLSHSPPIIPIPSPPFRCLIHPRPGPPYPSPSLLFPLPPLLSSSSFPLPPFLLRPSGQGLEGIADEDNWHGKPLGSKAQGYIDHLTQQIVNLHDNGGLKALGPEDALDVLEGTPAHPPHLLSQAPEYKSGDKVALVVVIVVLLLW